MDAMQLAGQERADLAEFLAGLSAGQWDTPTLCTRWRVRDVVAHLLSYDDLTAPGLLARAVRGRGRLGRVNDVGVHDHSRRSPEELLALLRDKQRPVGIPASFGGRVGLFEALIHHQDIRRPLGVPREIPVDRLAAALSIARVALPTGASIRVRGLRLIANDVDWAAGRGRLVQGPGESLLMAIAGRRGVTGDLTGDGQPLLAARVGG